MRGSRAARLRAAPVVLLVACLGCAEAHATATQAMLHAGTREAPVAGLRLAPDPVVYVRDLARLPAPGGVIALSASETVVTPRGRRHAVTVRRSDGKTALVFDGEPPIEREGELQVELDDEGRVLLTVRVEPGIQGATHVELLDRRGESLARIAFARVGWTALARDGVRFAVGTDAGVRVFARDGRELAKHPAARVGALSPDGAWLALERERELSLQRLDPTAQDAAWTLPVTEPALRLRAAPGRLIRIAPGRLLVVEHSSEEPAVVLDRPPPPGFVWRDALQEEDGTLLASRLKIERRPRRERDSAGGARFVAGSARVGIEELVLDPPARREVEWDVSLWNAAAPELASAGPGRRYALVWPSAFEVSFP
jgi:hypothetical protein